jgi:hypothetical protein
MPTKAVEQDTSTPNAVTPPRRLVTLWPLFGQRSEMEWCNLEGLPPTRVE